MTQFVSSSVCQHPSTVPVESSGWTIDHSAALDVISHPLSDNDRTPLPKWSRSYLSPSVSYMVFVIDRQSEGYSSVDQSTVSEAFERLSPSIFQANPQPHNPQVAVALREFLTFTKAYGWQPLFFDVAESLVPVIRSQGLATTKQCVQGSEFRYLAYRDSVNE